MISITLKNAGTVVLKPSLGAARLVTANLGSYIEALRRLANFDFSAFVSIIAAGLNVRPKEIEQDVFDTGLTDLVNPLSEFVEVLRTGPDRAKKAGEGAGTGEG